MNILVGKLYVLNLQRTHHSKPVKLIIETDVGHIYYKSVCRDGRSLGKTDHCSRSYFEEKFRSGPWGSFAEIPESDLVGYPVSQKTARPDFGKALQSLLSEYKDIPASEVLEEMEMQIDALQSSVNVIQE